MQVSRKSKEEQGESGRIREDMDSHDKKGIFRRYWHAKQEGQIFPFLVVILVLMLVAAVAFINTSQVNLRKTAVNNAADAAALAAANQLAGVANTMADLNVNTLWPNYMYQLQIFGGIVNFDLPGFVDRRFMVFINAALENMLTFLGMLMSGFKATQYAGGSALQSAFANLPIEEATKRKGSFSGELLQPNVSQWLDTINVYSQKTLWEPPPYTWSQYSYNLTTGKQEAVPGESVKVKVKKPDENFLTLYPIPALPSVTFFMMWVPGCYPYVGCYLCNLVQLLVIAARIEQIIGMVATAVILLAEFFASKIVAIYQAQYLNGFDNISSILTAAISIAAWCPTVINLLRQNQLKPDCNSFPFDICIFLFPVPRVAYMGNNDADISVEVTRFSPTKDLGLFQFKPQKITSGAKAGMVGGNINSPKSYKVKVHDVWDGERL